MSKNEMMTALKMLLDVDLSTANTLDGQSRICNWLYNALLIEAKDLREKFIATKEMELARIVYTERGLRNLLPKIKENKPFLKVVHSSPLKNTALRLSSAIQTHQKSKKGKRKGKVVNWPKFRSWKKAWFSLLYDEPNKGFKIEGDQLILSLGMGQDCKRRSVSVTIKEAHLLKEKEIRNLRIIKDDNQFFAIFTLKTIKPELKPVSRVVALDPNHKNLSYGVDAEGKAFEIAAPTWLKNHDKRIDELKSKRDRCKKKSSQHQVVDENGNLTGKTYFQPSRRWTKYHNTLKRLLKKRREQTKTFLFTTANYLYSRYDCVGIGDYTPNGNGISKPMRRAMNNQSLIGRFKEVLSWVALKSGKVFLEYEETGTTRTCHHCHYVVDEGIKPNIRMWACPTCKTIHNRDENAALNGLKKVLRDLYKKSEIVISQVSGSDLVPVSERWAWCVLPSGVRSIPRRQNSEKIAAARN